MEIANQVTSDEAIAILNVLLPSPPTYADFLEKLSIGITTDVPTNTERRAVIREWVGDVQRKVGNQREGFLQNYLLTAITLRPTPASAEQGWRLPGTVSRKESYPIREALTSAHLRRYVDQWLDTGRREDGSEEVETRDVRRAPDAHRALWHYLENASPRWDMVKGSIGVRLIFGERTGYSGVARDFFEAQIIEAKRLFCGIMLSDWKGRLCKCRYARCGLYFLHPKPRRSYRRGTFCHDHAKHAAAEASVLKSRSHNLETLINAAARKLRAWKILDPDWQGDVRLKRRLAGELCSVILRQKVHSHRTLVKLNWVTRNQAAIEQKRVELSAV
jgi:hypothetical protein